MKKVHTMDCVYIIARGIVSASTSTGPTHSRKKVLPKKKTGCDSMPNTTIGHTNHRMQFSTTV